MEEQHEVFLEKTEPAEPGPSQTAVVWSVMVFLWCEVWSSGGSARACCDDFHLPSWNMFPEIGHCSSISVQSWLTMVCVCGGVGVGGGGGWGGVDNRPRITPLLSRLSPVILSTMNPHPLTTGQQAMTQHLLPFVSTLSYVLACSHFASFFPPSVSFTSQRRPPSGNESMWKLSLSLRRHTSCLYPPLQMSFSIRFWYLPSI